MEKMKEELYNELHILKKDDKEIINVLISNYSNRYSNSRMFDYNEMKAFVKASYKTFKLNKSIELYNKYKNTIFINGMLIFNSYNDSYKRELYYTPDYDAIDCWVNGALVFSIKFELVRTIETRHETLYREDETLLW